MRLLRLTTREDTANFETSYQADLVLKPKSKIALQSVAINTLPTLLLITSVNNSITYQIHQNYSRTINLTQRSYSSGQILDLLNDIEDLLNDSVNYVFGATLTTKPLGLEWKTELVDKKVSIEYKIGRESSYFGTDAWMLNDVVATRQGSPTGDSFYVGATQGLPSVNTFDYTCEFPFPLARGCGYIRGRTARLETGNTNNGYIIGLTDSVDNFEGLDLSKVKYGVRVDCRTVPNAPEERFYRSIVDGVESAETVMSDYTQDSADNDYSEIMINGEQVEISYYVKDQNGVYQQNNLDVALYNNEDLFPFIAFFGTRATTRVDGVKLTPSPFGTQPDEPSSNAVEVSAPPTPIPPNAGGQENFIFFESIELSQFLGYTSQRIPINDFFNAYTVSYDAPNSYFIPQEADACLVQLMNLQIESYDSYSTALEPAGGQRKNILSIIPSTSSTGKIVYEPSYPTFLDLNNEQPIILRNLHIRVLREDYSPIAIDGLGTLVILIE
jgi:hypothetical protein